jgi:hypothetical protein
LKSENSTLIEECHNSKVFESEMHAKNYEFKNQKNELENIISSILLIVKAYAIKFEVSDHNDKIFEKTFAEKIKNFISFYNLKKEKNAYEAMKVIEDWVKCSCFQIEKAQQKANLMNDLIEESKNRINRLEKNLSELSFSEEEKINIQKNLNIKIKQLEEEKKLMLEDKDILERELEAIVKEFNHLKLEAKSKIQELGDSAKQIIELRFETENLKNEIFKQEKKDLNASFQEKALEERIKLILKERKYLENLLNKLASVHPVKNIARIVNDIMNICDLVSSLERDKMKIINNLNNINYENSLFKSDMDKNASYKSKHEKEENMKILNEYNRKIGKLILEF